MAQAPWMEMVKTKQQNGEVKDDLLERGEIIRIKTERMGKGSEDYSNDNNGSPIDIPSKIGK